MSSDRNRLILILSFLLLGGFLLTSWLSYRVAHDSVHEQIAESTLPLTSDNIYSEIQRDLLQPIFISSLMAQDTFVRDWALSGEQDPTSLVRYLNEIQTQYDTVTSFFVSDQTRRYYHSTGVLKTLSESDPRDAWYFRVRELPPAEAFEINVDSDTADSGSTVVFVNYRVYDFAGQPIGVTGVGLAVDSVKTLIERYQQRYQRRVYFVDREGQVTLHGSGFEGSESLHQRPGIASLAPRILASPSSSLSYSQAEGTVLVNSRLVPEFDWILVVEQHDAAAEERLLSTLLGNLLLSLAVTALVLVLAYLTFGRYQKRLEEMASTDKLTGAANRQVFDLLFQRSLQEAQRRGSTCSLLLFDIDYFKQVNDQYGHLAGDAVLKMVADETANRIRQSDTLCRWGGEEFMVLLPDCDLEQAERIAENLRSSIDERQFSVKGNSITTSISVGAAQYNLVETPLELIHRLDGAMFEAKRQGRNQVVSSASTVVPVSAGSGSSAVS
ncbi:sensor domain-containing diguanylate cyclase [Aestuariirhabdus sp. LZHN29]|uniref:sensor domain-containing diguanylate cyclase n=1 Tax=Aestuariirhabdus sp. LZHN29 TaxID=3417462 RepID=UPI003CFA2E45